MIPKWEEEKESYRVKEKSPPGTPDEIDTPPLNLKISKL